MRRNNKSNRPLGFHGYYVEVPPGGDAVRAYRKIKRWIKEDRFIETIREKSHFQKPSEIKREKEKKLNSFVENRTTLVLRMSRSMCSGSTFFNCICCGLFE